MRRLLATLALATTALVVPSGPAAGQSGVSASTDRGTARSGEEIVVDGTGWPADSRVQVSICGNQARALSADCDLPSSRTIVTDPEGSFALTLDVEVPPSPCPCVVFVSGQNTASTVRFPIEVLDAPSAPTTTPEITPARDFAVLRSTLTGSGPWTAWFGAAPTRTLELTVENTGTIAAAPNLSATWGTGSTPTHVLETPTLEPIEPGETAQYKIPVRFDALSFGSINVAGSVSGSSGPISFTTSTSTYPWALLALAAIAVQLVLLSIRNRVRSRLHGPGSGDPAGPDDPAELEPGAVAALPVGDGSDEPIDLTDDGPVAEPAPTPSEPVALADPYEADTARAVAASSALAARLRRETDVALLDHHEQAMALAADLRRDAAEQSALLRSSAQDAQEQLASSIASTREEASEAAAAAADEAAALVEEAMAHRDAARAVLDEATAHAHVVIGTAEKQAIRFEEAAARWQAERDAIAARHQEQIDELERVDARLRDVRGRIEGRAMAISEDADLRSQLLVERAAQTEAELRDEAHKSLVDIVTRSAQVSAATVFASATAPALDPDPEPAISARPGPAHLAETPRRRRRWRRARAVSANNEGT